MNAFDMQALRNAAASSAMEGLPFTQQDYKIMEQLLNQELTLADFLSSIGAKGLEK